MSAEEERFDGILLNVAQQAGSIENILDMFFGFMNRKTDFFTGSADESAAEKLVLKYYQKHWKVGLKKREETKEKNRIADAERKKRAEEKKKKDDEDYRKQQEAASEKPKFEEVTEEEAEKIKADKAAKKEEAASSSNAEKKDGDGEAEEEEESKEPPPEGNGGKTDKYVWTQTLSALEVHIPVRPGVKAKQITCDIGVDTIKFGIKGEPLMFEGKMHSKIKPDDTMWTLVDNKSVQITMEKFDNMKWWNCFVEGDGTIDTKKIVPENSKLSDLDGETRQTVEKMMYDQRQKALGKPTSEQEKQHDLLEKFKSAHPEMDFSSAKINYGGGGGGGMNFGG